jgi:hypothetical protein
VNGGFRVAAGRQGFSDWTMHASQLVRPGEAHYVALV